MLDELAVLVVPELDAARVGADAHVAAVGRAETAAGRLRLTQTLMTQVRSKVTSTTIAAILRTSCTYC